MLSDLRNPKPADTTGRKEFGRNSSIGVANPPNAAASARYPLNSASVTTVPAYSSKSDAPTITTLEANGNLVVLTVL